MPKKKGAFTLAEYKEMRENLDDTFRWLEKDYWNGYRTWDRYSRMDRGEHWGPWFRLMSNKDWTSAAMPQLQIVVNYAKSYAKRVLGFLVNQYPQAICTPILPEDVVAAQLIQQAVNYEFRRRKMLKQVRLCVQDAITYGTCFIEVGYNRKIAESEDQSITLDTRDYMFNDACFVERIPLKRFAFDRNAPTKDLDSAAWACRRHLVRPNYVKDNIYFKGEVQQGIIDRKYKPESLEEKPQSGEYYQKTELWTLDDYWNKELGWRMMWISGINRPLFEEPWPYSYLECLPFVSLRYTDLVDEWYGSGFHAAIEDLQLEVDRSFSAFFDFRRRELGGIHQVPDDMDQKERDKFLKGEKMIVYKTGSKGIDIVPNAPMTADQFKIFDLMVGTLKELTDSNELSLSGSRPPAAEVNVKSNFAMLGLNQIKTKTDEFTTEIYRQLIHHIKANFSGKKMAKIAGPLAEYWGEVSTARDIVQDPNSGVSWIPYTKDMIQGDFDLEIQSSSAPQRDPATELQQYFQFLQILQTLAQMAMTPQVNLSDIGGVNLYDFARTVGEKMGMKDIARFLPGAKVILPPIITQTQQAGAPQQGMPQIPQPPTPPNAGNIPTGPPNQQPTPTELAEERAARLAFTPAFQSAYGNMKTGNGQ